jgi:cytoskeletal protein CcmA (bactofilin family)
MAKTTNEMKDALAAETIVGHSVKIEGDLVSEGDIKVDGIVSGKVRTTQNLFVGPTAKIEADVDAGSATVAGVVEGNIKVNSLIVILQTGHVVGDIDCAQLAVEEGAYFSGHCKMGENQKNKTLKTPIDEEE